MKIYNRIDEKGRFCGFKATTEIGEQVDTHTYSYLFARKQYKALGYKMGLEIKNKTKSKSGLEEKINE